MNAGNQEPRLVPPRYALESVSLALYLVAAITAIGAYQEFAQSLHPFTLFILFAILSLTPPILILWTALRYRASLGEDHARAFRQIAPIFSGFALLFASLAFLLAPVYLETFSRAKLLGEIYVEEHITIIEADGKAMAIDLNRELDSLESSDAGRLIGAQAALKSLPVALVVRDDGEVVFDSSPYMDVSSEEVQRYLAHAEGEDQAVLVHSEDDAVVSVTKLDVRGADYLIVGRWIDERAVRDWRRAQNYIAVVGSNAGIWTTIVAVGVAILAVLAVWGRLVRSHARGSPAEVGDESRELFRATL